RAAQLRHLRPDLVVEPVRGNVDTRLRKLDEGQYQAILLAVAGLTRLGWSDRIAEALAPEVMCPAVGQGALGIETRTAGAAREVCALLDHPETRAAVTAERAVLRALGGGCQVPIGSHARADQGRLYLMAVVVSTDGRQHFRDTAEAAIGAPDRLGRDVGARLLARGAGEVL
ncbi:MAG: hydroxymethylbilane synthase, partial [Acidobacteria bacterium]|nr:hydroxymethylbilane synthase [Acidobacteriota bacterium]